MSIHKTILLFVFLLFHFTSFPQVRSSQATENDKANDSVHIDYSESSIRYIQGFRYVNFLSEEALSYIRMASLQQHLNYLNYYKSRTNQSKKIELCSRLKEEFVDFEEIFNPPDLEKVEIPDSVFKFFDKKPFHIWLHGSVNYPLWERESVDFRSEFTYRTVKLPINDMAKGDYIVYHIYDEIHDYAGIIAVNKKNYKDIVFIAGEFLPLKNMTPQMIFELSQRSRFEKFRDEIDRFRLRLPANFNMPSTYPGIRAYSGLLSSAFIPADLGEVSAQIIDYKDGSFTSVSDISYMFMQSWSICKTREFVWPNRFNTLIRPGPICNDYYGEIIKSLLVRINPSTGKVEFKINETVDISDLEECVCE